MKKEEYEGQSCNQIASSLSITRREFLKRMGVLGSGIVVYISFGNASSLAQPRRRGGALLAQVPTDFNAFLRIGADGKVTCFTGKTELGQGIMTSLAQMVADELDVTFDSIDMLMGDTDLCPWDMGTFGSLSTRVFGPILREAAAEAKAVLIELAAEYLKTPRERLGVKDGVIFDKTRTHNSVTYAQLAKGKRIERHLKRKPTLKAVTDFTVMGKSFLKREGLEKVTGNAKYGGDIRLPGMVYAKILRPPAHGARLKSVDVSGAKHVQGVLVVQEGDLIAVCHKHPDEAEKALTKIKAQFDVPDTKLDDKTIFEHLVKVAPEGNIASQGGILGMGEKLATDIFEEEYLNSYVAHAPMETHTAVANIEKGKATVWVSTQRPFGVKEEVARSLGFSPEKVHVITTFVGGGFGGKNQNREAVEAARLAKLTGKPVQVAWSRREEFFYDTFRPAAIVKIKSGVNAAGDIVFWDYNVYFAGQRGCEQFYEIPHHREAVHGEWRGIGPGSHPFAVGPWRAPANNTNTYARELHMNIMASKAGRDPLEFRLKHLRDKRMIGVLKAAAKKFGWRSSKTPSGRGYGIACSIDAGTYVATMAEVDVDKGSGKVQVKRVVCAQDMGFVVNPEGAKAQMEGCITMGLGYSLAEEIRFRSGEIFDLNFDTYNIPRISWVPEIETVLVENAGLSPQGGGEPAITGMGGVIATAIYDATGAKLFQLPMTPARVKEALMKVACAPRTDPDFELRPAWKGGSRT